MGLVAIPSPPIPVPHVPKSGNLLQRVDSYRIDAFGRADADRRSQLGQYATPPGVAAYMASLFDGGRETVRLLDAGAGVGSLTAAYVADAVARPGKPSEIIATAFELDPEFAHYLRTTLRDCDRHCQDAHVRFRGAVEETDFIEAAVGLLRQEMFRPVQLYDAAILNPPYRKINTDPETRSLLRAVGIETTNLYTAFLGLAIQLLDDGGELVAITPRSFCNGPYFKPFRKQLLRSMELRHIHVFESRSKAFSDDDVLQENIVFHAVKTQERRGSVVVTASGGPDELGTSREMRADQLVKPGDPDLFIHIATDEAAVDIADWMGTLTHSLDDIGLKVSTGRVVEFRSRAQLRQEYGPGCVPLIYPAHFEGGWIAWPKKFGRKPAAIAVDPVSQGCLVPAAIHVLVKRFSAKEEKRRLVAAIFDPLKIPCEAVGFENHVNFFHQTGGGLGMDLAKGLTAFLNSTLLDEYLRQFNGHTQVNAADLRNIKYPSRARLEALGGTIGDRFPPQEELDRLIESKLMGMAKKKNLLQVKQKIGEALAVLTALGMPKEQQNDRSALTLLTLLGLTPSTPWAQATAPLMGITPMMGYFAEHYGRNYAPNSRETVRRFTVHQLEQAGLVVLNPDGPRAVNSPANVYQIEASTLELLRTYGTPDWGRNLETFSTERRW